MDPNRYTVVSSPTIYIIICFSIFTYNKGSLSFVSVRLYERQRLPNCRRTASARKKNQLSGDNCASLKSKAPPALLWFVTKSA